MGKTRSRQRNIKNDNRPADVKAKVALKRSEVGEQSSSDWFSKKSSRATRKDATSKKAPVDRAPKDTVDVVAAIPIGEAMQKARESARVRALARVEARAQRNSEKIGLANESVDETTLHERNLRYQRRRRLLARIKIVASAVRRRMPHKTHDPKWRRASQVNNAARDPLPSPASASPVSEYAAGTKVCVCSDGSIATVLASADGDITILCGDDVRTVSFCDLKAL